MILRRASPRFRLVLLMLVTVTTAVLVERRAYAQTRLRSIYDFQGLIVADGAGPVAPVIRDAAGNLFGTTPQGGDRFCHIGGCGTVFRIDAMGREHVLHHFSGSTDGSFPYGALLRDTAGDLYGTAYEGGLGYGVVFRIAPDGTLTPLYSFTGGSDGANPYSGLVMDAAGNLYGTTVYGGVALGSAGYGTVFKLDQSGVLTVLYSFAGGADGQNPQGVLILDANGNFYGTTLSGGDTRCGAG